MTSDFNVDLLTYGVTCVSSGLVSISSMSCYYYINDISRIILCVYFFPLLLNVWLFNGISISFVNFESQLSGCVTDKTC